MSKKEGEAVKSIRTLIALLLVFSLVFCAGCIQRLPQEEDASAESMPAAPEQEPEPTETPVPETPEPVILYNQLTGLDTETDVSHERPYAVMINNIIYAQPQVGIGEADWIYEIEAEGGITRMMALYTHISDVPVLGSMRSLRPYYLSIALSYDAIMLHAGRSYDAQKRLDEWHADHLDGVKDQTAYAAMFYRDPSRGAHGLEHTMFMKGDKVVPTVEKYGFRQQHEKGFRNGLSFSPDSVSLCTADAMQVKVIFNSYKTMTMTYNAESGVYTGTQYGAPYADGATGEEVPFSNVLILFVDMSVYGEKNRIDAGVTGEGTGYYCTGGRYVPIKWTRAGNFDPYEYTTENGEPLTFTPGKTYCAVVPNGKGDVNFS